MLSKNRKKFIRRLSQKKVRQVEGQFLAEGDKVVRELLFAAAGPAPVYRVHTLVATGEWLKRNRELLPEDTEIIECSLRDLKQASTQQTPNQALAVAGIPAQPDFPDSRGQGLVLGLYRLGNPGNLGTILRVADWFGVSNIICSPGSVDLYNPKVIQASMGSFLRVSVLYRELNEVAGQLKKNPGFRVYASSIRGSNLYKTGLEVPCLLLAGNESHGLPGVLRGMADLEIGIPCHDPESHAESLNVAVATALFCAEIRRRGL